MAPELLPPFPFKEVPPKGLVITNSNSEVDYVGNCGDKHTKDHTPNVRSGSNCYEPAREISRVSPLLAKVVSCKPTRIAYR